MRNQQNGRVWQAVAGLLLTVILWANAMPAFAADSAVYTVATDGDVLNVRENPWMGATITGRLRPGDTVRVSETKDGWANVTAPDAPLAVEAGSGWVRADYLTQETIAETTCQNTSGGPLLVRDAPGGGKVRKVPKDGYVTVTRWTTVDGVEWGYVGDGYVRGDCLTEVMEP